MDLVNVSFNISGRKYLTEHISNYFRKNLKERWNRNLYLDVSEKTKGLTARFCQYFRKKAKDLTEQISKYFSRSTMD